MANGQARPIYDPVTQSFVAQGYAVLEPNVRGSTGYGYEYQSLDDVRLRMDSVADLQHAALWLQASGIANFVTFLENTGPWRRKLREPEYGSLEYDRDLPRKRLAYPPCRGHYRAALCHSRRE